MRTHHLPATSCAGIILAMSAEPLGELRPGPLLLLLLLRKLAGESRRLSTYTASLATMLDRCPNTIRTWRAELEEAGYIHFSTSMRTGQTTFYVLERVETPARRAAAEEQRRIEALPAPLPWHPARPIALPPDPAPWWRKPAPALRPWKTETSQGGAQKTAPIKILPRKARPREMADITEAELAAVEAGWSAASG